MKPFNIIVKTQGKITVLNWKNIHFNLIVGPNHMLSQCGSLKFQSANQHHINLNQETELKSLDREKLVLEERPKKAPSPILNSCGDDCKMNKTFKQRLAERDTEIRELKEEVKRLKNKSLSKIKHMTNMT